MIPTPLIINNFEPLGKEEYGTGLGLAVTRWMLKNEPSLLVPGFNEGKVSVEKGEAGKFALADGKLYYADSQHKFPSDDFYSDGTPRWDVDAKLHMDYQSGNKDSDTPCIWNRKEIFIEFKTGQFATWRGNQKQVMEALSCNKSDQICRDNNYLVLLCKILPDKKNKKMIIKFYRFSELSDWTEFRQYEYSDFPRNQSLDAFSGDV